MAGLTCFHLQSIKSADCCQDLLTWPPAITSAYQWAADQI